MDTKQMFLTAALPVFRRLTHRRIRRFIILFLLLLLLTCLFVYKNKFKSRIMKMNEKEELEECFKFINKQVTRCLKEKERKKQNKLFANIQTDLPIKPMKMTLTTAVFLFDNGKREFVIKRVMIKPETNTQEREIALALKHENLLNSSEANIVEYRQLKTGEVIRILWLFSEYLNVRISHKSVNKNETVIRNILRGTLKGLAHMHERNIVHLDLKIANIMGHQSETGIVYKIIDFGYSRQLLGDSSGNGLDEIKIPKKAYGTFPYKPPETVRHNIHGKAGDIWCIGAIAWFLSLKGTPFYHSDGEKNTEEYKYFLDHSDAGFDFSSSTSKNLKDFIIQCMQRDRKKRPTVKALLNHPFITNNQPVKKVSSKGEKTTEITTDVDLMTTYENTQKK